MPILRSHGYSFRAYQKVSDIINNRSQSEQAKYKTFAKRFPTLIHTCGLAQALAFVKSKDEYTQNLADLIAVLNMPNLSQDAKTVQVMEYLRLSREAISGASWLKKYAEALIEDPNNNEDTDNNQ